MNTVGRVGPTADWKQSNLQESRRDVLERHTFSKRCGEELQDIVQRDLLPVVQHTLLQNLRVIKFEGTKHS